MVDEAHRLKNDDSLRTLIVFDTSYTITKLIKRTLIHFIHQKSKLRVKKINSYILIKISRFQWEKLNETNSAVRLLEISRLKI